LLIASTRYDHQLFFLYQLVSAIKAVRSSKGKAVLPDLPPALQIEANNSP
jgi:hypothetical protein